MEDPNTSFTLLPNNTDYHFTSEYRVSYHINSQGFRGDVVELPKPAHKKYILILGDSFIFGHGVEEGQTVSAQLEKLYKQDGNEEVEVINGGYMAGKSIDDAYAFLNSDRGRDFKPDVIVSVVFFGNDFNDVEEHTWVETDEYGLPIKVRSAYDFPNKLHGRGVIPWYKDHQVLNHINTLQLVMHAYQVMFVIPSQLERARKSFSTVNEDIKISQKFKKVVVGMKNLARRQGARLVIGLLPKREQLDDQTPTGGLDKRLQELKLFLIENQIRYLEFNEGCSISAKDYYSSDGHWRPSAHEKAASALYRLLQGGHPKLISSD